MTEAGLYVYAVVAGRPTALGTGIDGRGLRLVSTPEGPAAVVHDHTAGPYTGPDDDVRRWVLEHSDVVDRLWQRGETVLPASFNVIVAPGEDEPPQRRLVDWLATHSADLLARCAALEGRTELRVGIALAPEEAAAGDPDIAALRAEVAAKPPGVQRLMRKRLDQRTRAVAEALAESLYPDYRRRLAAASEDVSEARRPQADPDVVPVLDAALLVPRDGVEAVGRELAAIQDEQPAVRIRYLGPWPPYSFVDLPTPDAVPDTPRA
ncbi:GvpL/GvpF family gas vesicle protein [Xylanimonas sp. McL0601]|uniref:GvpL/GvpF family gas vesicle protein n=1 Tax=Xylanimonas sp. McL0601 TaxID=3414739 RepID=UPI003CED0B2E